MDSGSRVHNKLGWVQKCLSVGNLSMTGFKHKDSLKIVKSGVEVRFGWCND